MRPQSIAAALSLASAALALYNQFPINTIRETSVRPLNVINSNPGYLNNVSSDSEQWNLDECPPENVTGHLIFDTVNSFLQHWPNTRYRNGHNIVPGVIPIGTLLYHGTSNGSHTIPSGPEWTAMNPEHSIFFCRGNGSGCWHLTLVTSRPLKVLYFDGSSAAKLSEGTMDTQDLITWGEPQPKRFFDERDRINNLCTWGKEFGIHGFARMEMSFEIMLCDFTANVEVVSFVQLTLPRDDPSSSPSTSLDSDIWVRTFEIFHSGLWQNHYPGDSRIVLDLTGLISLYDTALAPSLISVRTGLERYDHRVLGISSDDISRVMRKLIKVITRPHPIGSGIDWKTLIHVIVDRYADRLELTHYLINAASSNRQELLERAKLVQTQLRVMLTPYLLQFTTIPGAGTSGIYSLQWASPIFGLCVRTHTSQITDLIPLMTSSERLLLKAVEDTTREICRVTTKMWAAGVMNGFDTLFPVEPNGELDITQIMNDWKQDIQKLMSWLDWSVWIKCRPACGPEEVCYLSSCPINYPRELEQPKYPTTPVDDWNLPQPRCIRRLQPYGF
ncbi:hypothetical protein BDR07DRAFT_1358925 [Suillus spraguei]|nr:hypothetical protein BDR07DRAFT_1358925 [Suillus spraguei]